MSFLSINHDILQTSLVTLLENRFATISDDALSLSFLAHPFTFLCPTMHPCSAVIVMLILRSFVVSNPQYA